MKSESDGEVGDEADSGATQHDSKLGGPPSKGDNNPMSTLDMDNEVGGFQVRGMAARCPPQTKIANQVVQV